MVNYDNGKIYMIEPICEHDEGDIYIGSTTKEYLSQRFVAHKKNYKRYKSGKPRQFMTSFIIFEKYGIDNCRITLIEEVSCQTKDELMAKEAQYIRTLKCVNKCIPNRSKAQYRFDNKENVVKKF